MKDVLLDRYFRNEATLEEVQQIEDWLRANPAHREEFDRAHMLFNLMVLQQAKYSDGGRVRTLRVRRSALWLRIAASVAAALLLILGAGYVGGRVGRNRIYRDLSGTMQVLEVPAGQRMTITLQDGTVVCMNGGTRMEYPLLFDQKRRHIKLSGEALLEVTHNPEQPFVVETFASEIEVLGTKFNVYADDEHNRFTATLVNGKLKVTNLIIDRREQIVLHPDEMVRLVNNHLMMSKVTDRDQLSWVDGYIDLRNIAFDELMQRFERTYGVKIVIDRPKLPKVGYISGKIRVSAGVDFALHLLQRTSDFTYTKNEETNTIYIR